jgi:hypothetical protein|tara:strand:- start:139 stop:357 length:219 start_codon:yes stop_codon:yes gene_type:complete
MDEDQDRHLLNLFDNVHDTIHMLRMMAAHYAEKAEALESDLAGALRCNLVDLSELEVLSDNVIPFPVGSRDE